MIVISNTSPLTNLAAIGQFHLLHKLYKHIDIADGVWVELNAYEQSWPGSDQVANASWVKRRTVKNMQLVNSLHRDLDRGEAESIALALELSADLILLDERDGRHAARHLGLRVVGVLGILLEAKQTGLIETVRPHMDALRQTAGFYLKEGVCRAFLELARE